MSYVIGSYFSSFKKIAPVAKSSHYTWDFSKFSKNLTFLKFLRNLQKLSPSFQKMAYTPTTYFQIFNNTILQILSPYHFKVYQKVDNIL